MANISVQKFIRVLDRAADVHEDPSCYPTVSRLFEDILAAPAVAFRSAYSAELDAHTARNTARLASILGIDAIDLHYMVVRAVVAARFPSVVLPGSLKSQPTDTDTKVAVQFLLGTVEAYRAEAWATEILASTFGTMAPDVIAKIEASIAASSAFVNASAHRGTTMDTAYTAFLGFKDAVRQAHGIGSTLYSRLKLRVKSTPAVTPVPPVAHPTPTVTASAPAAAEAPTNGVAH